MKSTTTYLKQIGIAAAAIAASIGIGLSEERVALIVGNGNYPEDGLFADLENPTKDAALIAATLEKAGFKVITADNADRTTMRMKLREFEEAIEPGGTALFYFAGHGVQFEGENYLIGSNARFEKKYELGEEAMKANTFLEAIAGKKPKTALMFLDCCRESPPKSWVESETRGMRKRGLSDMQHPDVVISFAAAPNEPAYDGEGTNSPFASALSKHLLSGDELGRVLKAVANDVYKDTKNQQRPWWNGSLLHDFYFVKEQVAPVQLAETIPDTEPAVTEADAIKETPKTSTATTENGVDVTLIKIGNDSAAVDVAPNVDLPSRGYFSNREVFGSGPYAGYNEYTRKKILKKVQAKVPYSGSIDGVMGKKSQQGIIDYQKTNALAINGVLDSATLKSLGLSNLKEEHYTAPVTRSTTKKSSSSYSTKKSTPSKPAPQVQYQERVPERHYQEDHRDHSRGSWTPEPRPAPRDDYHRTPEPSRPSLDRDRAEKAIKGGIEMLKSLRSRSGR